MKNQSIVVEKKQNGDLFVKKIKLVAFSDKRYFTETEKTDFRFNYIKSEMRMVHNTKNTLGESIIIFDFYTVEKGNFLQLALHRFRMLKTAVLDYIGISTIIIKVIR